MILAALTASCSADVADDTFLLGAGSVIDWTADSLDRQLLVAEELDPVESVSASDGSWSGVVSVDLASADDLGLDCDGAPCTLAWTARLTLDDVVLRDGGRAQEYDDGFDCVGDGFAGDRCDTQAGFGFDPPDVHLDGIMDVVAGWRQEEGAGTRTSFWHLATTEPASLRARGFTLERTASLTVTYDADWDDFSGHVRVSGTVDGAATAYDYGWTD